MSKDVKLKLTKGGSYDKLRILPSVRFLWVGISAV